MSMQTDQAWLQHDYEVLDNLAFDGDKAFGTIRAVLRLRNLHVLWRDFLFRDRILEVSLLTETLRNLDEYGIRKETVLNFLRFLFCANISRVYDKIHEDPRLFPNKSVEETWQFISIAIECQVIQTDSPSEVLNSLEIRVENKQNKEDFLYLWSIVSCPDLVGDFDDEWLYMLGVPFICIQDIYPDVMAWRANHLYSCGGIGADHQAREMMVRAAINGSEFAWKRLYRWAFDCDDKDAVFSCIIETGCMLVSEKSELPDFAKAKVSELIEIFC